jgi:Fe2+ or Zn2+ uptake regulation protein
MNVLEILKKTKFPVDVNCLISELKVNKTTVYRQIEKLLINGQILEVELGDGKKRYEINTESHHHHLVCKNCGKLEDIILNENVILNEVSKKTKFKIEKHSLEFFGLCEDCK